MRERGLERSTQALGPALLGDHPPHIVLERLERRQLPPHIVLERLERRQLPQRSEVTDAVRDVNGIYKQTISVATSELARYVEQIPKRVLRVREPLDLACPRQGKPNTPVRVARPRTDRHFVEQEPRFGFTNRDYGDHRRAAYQHGACLTDSSDDLVYTGRSTGPVRVAVNEQQVTRRI